MDQQMPDLGGVIAAEENFLDQAVTRVRAEAAECHQWPVKL